MELADRLEQAAISALRQRADDPVRTTDAMTDRVIENLQYHGQFAG
jgi:hypothetical protein